jgi:hypothetical protein
LKTPQIQAVSEAFEQPSLTLFFKNPTFKKVYKTKKFLFEKKKNCYRRALFLNVILNLTKSIRIIESKGRYKTNLKHYIKIKDDNTLMNQQGSHLIPRQYSFLLSNTKPKFKINRAMGIQLLQQACIVYKENLNCFRIQKGNNKIKKNDNFKFK